MGRPSSVGRVLLPFGESGVGIVVLLGLLAIGGAGPIQAQDADSLGQAAEAPTYRVKTTNGSVVVGTLVSESETEVVLKTRQLGEVTLQRANIKRIEKIDPERIRGDGTYWFRNPQSTRYFFAPSALGIPGGEGYYQNTWVLFNNVNYGLTDNLSIGAGTVPIFLFGADVVPIWILPKVSVSTPSEHVHFAGGAVLGGVFSGAENVGLGLFYGSATVGTRDHNATLGVGYGYADGELSDAPVLNASGMVRLSRSFYVISENYVFPGTDSFALLSAGLRWAPRNFAVDFGLFRPFPGDTGGVVGLPWLGVTIPFG